MMGDTDMDGIAVSERRMLYATALLPAALTLKVQGTDGAIKVLPSVRRDRVSEDQELCPSRYEHATPGC